jgi:HdeA/HdeB family
MTTRTLLLLGVLLVYAGGSIATPQQLPSAQMLSRLSTPKQFDLSKITCRKFLNASLDDRAYLLMIYWGFEAAKMHTTRFVTADIRNRSQKVIDYCASAPSSPMFAAVEKFAR